jgi:hypothetical protein
MSRINLNELISVHDGTELTKVMRMVGLDTDMYIPVSISFLPNGSNKVVVKTIKNGSEPEKEVDYREINVDMSLAKFLRFLK